MNIMFQTQPIRMWKRLFFSYVDTIFLVFYSIFFWKQYGWSCCTHDSNQQILKGVIFLRRTSNSCSLRAKSKALDVFLILFETPTWLMLPKPWNIVNYLIFSFTIFLSFNPLFILDSFSRFFHNSVIAQYNVVY